MKIDALEKENAQYGRHDTLNTTWLTAHAISFHRDLGANCSAQRGNAFIDDAVENLHTVTALTQNTRVVKRVQVLRHVRLRCVDFTQQFADVFFCLAQTADDFQSHGRRHHAKNFCGQFEDFIGLGSTNLNFLT